MQGNNGMAHRFSLLVVAAVLASGCATQHAPTDFADDITQFASDDLAQPPPACNALFVGSSSIRLWRTLAADMAPYPVLNRGFGGSTIADVNFYFNRVVAPYASKVILFYAGENDIALGYGPERVVADFKTFLELKGAALTDTPVYFVSLKPSVQREDQLDKQQAVNISVQTLAHERTDLHYVDVRSLMFNDGHLRNIFEQDGLHMTAAGYAIWTAAIRPLIADEFAKPDPHCSARPR
jgi:lysophospholipase L1-like esterase